MRILGFQRKWEKLQKPEFTTFRFERRDKDWQLGEQVQIVYKPRHKDREILGIAVIVGKEFRSPDAELPKRNIISISDEEAKEDGFMDYEDMWNWLLEVYGDEDKLMFEPMNKLTLRKIGSW